MTTRTRAGSSASYMGSIADGEPKSPQDVTKTITNALLATDYPDCIKDLPSVDIDPQSYIDGLDKVPPRFVHPPASRSWSWDFRR
jgi:hypothetical protein